MFEEVTEMQKKKEGKKNTFFNFIEIYHSVMIS